MDTKVVVEFDKSYQVWEAADNGKTGRPTLEVVQLRHHLGRWWLVATDGWMLAMVPAQCQNMDDGSEVNPEMTFVINADILKTAAKGRKSEPAFIVINTDGTERTSYTYVNDPGDPERTVKLVQYEGFSVTVGEMTIKQDHTDVLMFPDWTPILVAVNGKCANPVFNPMLLVAAAKALGRYGANVRDRGLILRQNEPNEPIVVYRTPDSHRSEEKSPYIGPTALIMPLNVRG